MNGATFLFRTIFQHLLQLYPRSLREEFGEEMSLDFEELLKSASRNSMISVFAILLREFYDAPFNILRAHLDEKHMPKLLKSQPVGTGFRGAIGFGLAFAGASIIDSFFIFGLTSTIPFLNRLGNITFEFFGKENMPSNLSLLFLIVSVFAALTFGMLFALFIADRSRYPRYILAGTLGWFAPSAVSIVFSNNMNAEYYLDPGQLLYLYGSFQILFGAFLGVIFSVAKSERHEPLQWLAFAAIIFPVVTYILVKAVYYFDAVNTPWLFSALMIMLLTYFAGVLLIAFSGNRKMLWMVFVGAVIYPLASYLPSLLFPQQMIDPFYGHEQGLIVNSLLLLGTNTLQNAFQQTLIGLQMGLILGILLSLVKKDNSPQAMA